MYIPLYTATLESNFMIHGAVPFILCAANTLWGKQYNLRRLQAKPKVQTDMLYELLYTGGMSRMPQQRGGCKRLWIEFHKPVITKISKSAHGKTYSEPAITVNGQRVQVVDKFTYLGSTLSWAVHIDDAVTARIAKASVAFGRLRGNVWYRSGIRLDTKLEVYNAVVLPTFLYARETWTVYQRHAKRLNLFKLSCLRKLLKIRWQNKIPDSEVLKRAGMQSLCSLWKLEQLRWTGYVTRMLDEWLPKKVFYGEFQVGKLSQGGQKKRFKDTLKVSLKDFNILLGSWEQIAQDREKWRSLIRRGADEQSKESLRSWTKAQRLQSHSQGITIRVVIFRTDVLELTLSVSRLMTKPTKWHVRPAKTQISLGIRPVWSESSLSAWRELGSLATHWAHSEDSDQTTGRMPRLICVFAGRTCHFVGFVTRRLLYLPQTVLSKHWPKQPSKNTPTHMNPYV